MCLRDSFLILTFKVEKSSTHTYSSLKGSGCFYNDHVLMNVIEDFVLK